jgi:hypothetical protein
MKTSILFFSIAVLFLFTGKSIIAQNNTLCAKLTKTSGNIYTISNNGKHLISFEISGIENQKHADNLIKFVRGYRGVEEFNIQQINGTNSWQASGIFYEFADLNYFINIFKLMKIQDVIQDGIKISIENLKN